MDDIVEMCPVVKSDMRCQNVSHKRIRRVRQPVEDGGPPGNTYVNRQAASFALNRVRRDILNLGLRSTQSR